MKTLHVQEPAALSIHGNAQMYRNESNDWAYEGLGIFYDWVDEDSNLQTGMQ